MARGFLQFRISHRGPMPHLMRGATTELAWIVLALSLGLTILAYCMLHVQASRHATDALRAAAGNSTSAIKNRFAISTELLRSAAAMLVLDRTIQNATWQQYQRNLANQGWPAEVLQLGYAHRIASSEKTALSATMRADAMPDYQIHPPYEEAAHAPILFLAPPITTRTTEGPGFDLLSAPATRVAIQAATDSGAITLHSLGSNGSIGPSAGQTDTPPTRAILVLPLFPGNAVPPTISLRRQRVLGFVFVFIDVNAVVKATDVSPYRLMRLIDISDSTTNSLTKHAANLSEQVLTIPFDLFGNRWRADVMLPTIPAIPVMQPFTGNAEIVGVCGGIISALLFAIIRLLAAVQRVHKLHSRRTSREIRQLKQQLFATLLCSEHAILVVDRRQRIITFNPAAESIFGVRAETAIGIGLSRFLPHKLSGAKRVVCDASNVSGVSSANNSAAPTGFNRTIYRLPSLPSQLARRYNGDQFPFEASIYQCEQGSQQAMLIFLKDLTNTTRTMPEKTVSPVATADLDKAATSDARKLVDSEYSESAHFDIVVGTTIDKCMVDWHPPSTNFARRSVTRDGAPVVAHDQPSSIPLQSISVGEFIDTYLHVDDRALIKQQWREAFFRDIEVDCVYRVIFPNGKIQMMRHWMTPTSTKNGEHRFAGVLHRLLREENQLMRGATREASQEVELEDCREALQGANQATEREIPQKLQGSLISTFGSPLETIHELALQSRDTLRLQPQPQQISYHQSPTVPMTSNTIDADVPNTVSPPFQPDDRRRRDPNALDTDRLYRQLRSRLLQFDTARDEQQKRLAQEMHDDFGQLLSAMKMDLIVLQTQLSTSDSRLSQQLGDVSDLVDTMVSSVRRIVANQPPEQIEEHGLVKGLELLANAHSHRYKVCCRLHTKPHLPPLDTALTTPIYRIVQESLNNVAKHAHATKVDIHIEYRNHKVYLRVTDNGSGIAPSTLANVGGYGLIGMRERVSNLKGEMKIDTAIECGTTIYIVIPVELELTL